MRNVRISVGVLVVAVGVYWLAGLEKAAPTVEMAAMIHDLVKQGDMIREVRGPGTLARYRFKGDRRHVASRCRERTDGRIRLDR